MYDKFKRQRRRKEKANKTPSHVELFFNKKKKKLYNKWGISKNPPKKKQSKRYLKEKKYS